MPQRNLDLVPCTFIGVKGPCTNQCFRGRCSRHKNKTTLTLCKHCGKRGTLAAHGYCTSVESGCRWKAQHQSRVLKAERESWDAYLDDLIETFDASALEPCMPIPGGSGALPVM